MFKEFFGYVIPHEDINREDMAEKVLLSDNWDKYKDREIFANSNSQIEKFLEDRAHSDSWEYSDDITEEELDQALFEATYTKEIVESDEYKSIGYINI